MTEQSQLNGLPAVPVTMVFGADGFIGSNILIGLRQANPDCVGVARRPSASRLWLDLARPDIGPLKLKAQGITHAVIAAGIPGVAVCEREPAATRAVNVHGTAELARQLTAEGVRVVAFSSDYVFDGVDGNYVESSPVNPLNEYGRQKVEMERSLLLSGGGDLVVVRLSKVFDACRGSGTLLDKMAASLLRGIPVRAAFDQYFCPTLIDDVVMAVNRLLVSKVTGVVHLCAPTRTNRLDVAIKVADAFGCSRELVQRVSLCDLNKKLLRPLDTSMVCYRLASLWTYSFRNLDSCIEELKYLYS